VEQIVYKVRRSERASRVRVTVDAANGIEVVLPRSAGEREAATAISELRPWIERRVRELDGVRAIVAARGNTLPYLGEMLRIVAEPGRTRAHRRGSELLVPRGSEQAAAVERWYRRAARSEIEPRLDDACRLAGSSYSRLSIRGQRTRWASCSRDGAMSFNWRLLLAPEPVLEYVVWHEVCHLEILDHSPRFWALLGRRCPDYREHARWLRRHGATLVL
jgi:predicted metal-dependent hydrolase